MLLSWTNYHVICCNQLVSVTTNWNIKSNVMSSPAPNSDYRNKWNAPYHVDDFHNPTCLQQFDPGPLGKKMEAWRCIVVTALRAHSRLILIGHKSEAGFQLCKAGSTATDMSVLCVLVCVCMCVCMYRPVWALPIHTLPWLTWGFAAAGIKGNTTSHMTSDAPAVSVECMANQRN